MEPKFESHRAKLQAACDATNRALFDAGRVDVTAEVHKDRLAVRLTTPEEADDLSRSLKTSGAHKE